MCFIVVSIIALMIINNIYINNYTRPTLILVSGALTRLPSPTLITPLGAVTMTHSLNSSDLYEFTRIISVKTEDIIVFTVLVPYNLTQCIIVANCANVPYIHLWKQLI